MNVSLATATRRARHVHLGLVAAVFAAASVACDGTGSGQVSGTIDVKRCKVVEGSDPDIPEIEPLTGAFDLSPKFFTGEAIDSLGSPYQPNVLILRLQRRPLRLEFADALVFYILDSYEVARCVRRGMDAAGTPDWNPQLCDLTTDGNRIFIGTEHEVIRSFLTLVDRCPAAMTTATALGACDVDGSNCPAVTLCPGRSSWISFDYFGKAVDRNVDPANTFRPKTDFRVEFGERIRARSLHVELCDLQTIEAQKAGRVPVPASQMSAVLDGNFDFDLNRSQRL